MKTKRLLTAILAVTLTLSLFACGKLPEETTTQNETTEAITTHGETTAEITTRNETTESITSPIAATETEATEETTVIATTETEVNSTSDPVPTPDSESATTETEDEAETEGVTNFDYFGADMEEYASVNAEALENIELEISKDYIIDENDVKEYVEALRYEYKTPVNKGAQVTDRAIARGDSAFVYYKMFIGETLYEDGSWWDEDEPEEIVVGAYEYYPAEFEELLLGMIPSSTSEESPAQLKVIFPEDFWDEALAGEEVTVNLWIIYSVQYTLPEYNEDFILNTLEYEPSDGCEDVVAEFEAVLLEELKAEGELFLEFEMELVALEHLYDNVTVTAYPQSELDLFCNNIIAQMEELKASYDNIDGMDFDSFDEFAIFYLGLEEGDDWQVELDRIAHMAVMHDVVIHAFAQANNVTLTDEDYRATVEEMAELYGTTPEDIEETYGEYALKESALQSKVIAYVIENSTIIYK